MSVSSGLNLQKKNALYLSVNVFSTKVLIGDTILTSPTGDGTTILHDNGHPSRAKVVPSFLSYFKTLGIGPGPGIESVTSPSAVKHSAD